MSNHRTFFHIISLLQSTRTVRALSFSVLVVFGCSVVLLLLTVRDVVRIEGAEKKAMALNSEIGGLEELYLSFIRGTLTLEEAKKRGFIEVGESVRFVSIVSEVRHLSKSDRMAE